MIDPNDPGTLDLVEACERPMTVAERQRKLRRDRKAAGLKPVHLSDADRQTLAKALSVFHRMAADDGVPDLLRKILPGALSAAATAELDSWRGYWDSSVKAVRAEGLELFRLELTAEELDELSSAVCTHWRSWEKHKNGWRARAAECFWRRWVTLRWGYEYGEDDPKWSATAQTAQTLQIRKELKHAAWSDPDAAPYMLTARDRSYLRSALDYYDYLACYGGKGDFQKDNLLELYSRLGPALVCDEVPEWPVQQKRKAWEHLQINQALYDDYKSQIEKLKAQVKALKAPPPIDWQARAEKAEAELAYLRAELRQIGGSLPVTN